MRPRRAQSRRAIARTLALVGALLWPGLVWAGPPVLPPSHGGGAPAAAEPAAQNTLIASQGHSVERPPLQRPSTVVSTTPEPPPPSASPAASPVATPIASPAVEAATPVDPPQTTAPAQPSDPAACSDAKIDALIADSATPPDDPKDRYPHRGLVADLRVGTLGCIGPLCRTGHDVSPGARLGGFIGGNVRGWFELGLGGGWGTMATNITPGTNALVLYGLDPGRLQQALAAQAAGLVNIDFAGLAVQEGRLRAAQLGPSMRIHVRPRGRIGAFVGSGVGYNVLRARYETAAGDVGLDFHGIEVPVEANLSVYLHEHVAVGLQFDYMWTWYGVAVLDHPQQRVALPMGVLQAAGEQQGVDLRGQLPQFWTLGLAVRGRL